MKNTKNRNKALVEMLDETKDVFTRFPQHAVKLGKDALQSARMFLLVSGFPYAMPTYLRNLADESPGREPTGPDAIGVWVGVPSLFAQVALFSEYPEYWPIPASTNLISLGYEVCRAAYRRADRNIRDSVAQDSTA